ncbi:hypothetical protein RB595_005308 [Gaeumannomyces hyphopodioides]
MSPRDDWPSLPDGSDYDGTDLLSLVRSGRSPFAGVWDVNQLIEEVEANVDGAQVVNIPVVRKGASYYGFKIKLSDGREIVARLARGDVNKPYFDGFPVREQVDKVMFERQVYHLLRSKADILVSRLFHFRAPVQKPGPRVEVPRDLAGRTLFLFEKAEGWTNMWDRLDGVEKNNVLYQAAHIRASLFKFSPPLGFIRYWHRDLVSKQGPESTPVAVAPTREYGVARFTAEIEAIIGNVGDIIGREDGGHTVSPTIAAAKQSLLRLVPHIMPEGSDEGSLYRLVLEHGDFGVHNMTITTGVTTGVPRITSLFDWKAGHIVPAIFSDPLMAVNVNLGADEDAEPSITRVARGATPSERKEYMGWAEMYLEYLFDEAPEYKHAFTRAGDARYIRSRLLCWRGEDPEGFFGELGTWAEEKLEEFRRWRQAEQLIMSDVYGSRAGRPS